MQTEPFQLKDRISPEEDNDEAEVIRLGNALDNLAGRKPPPRAIGHVDQKQIIDRTRDFQAARGLKIDGLVKPKGPTQQRIAAEKFRRDSAARPPRHTSVLGRGANVPLAASIGPGRSNLAGDVKTVHSALTLTGHKPPAVIRRQASDEDAEGAAALQPSIRKFQNDQGLKVDGLVEPYGPTHDLMDDVIAPRLALLTGNDPVRPKPWQPPKPEIVARNVPLIPTRIRTRFQDEEDLPTRTEYDAAVRLGERIDAEEQAVEAFRRNFPEEADPALTPVQDLIDGGSASTTLSGGSGADVLEAGDVNPVAGLEHSVSRSARALHTPANSGPEAGRALTKRLQTARRALIEGYIAQGMSPEEASLTADAYVAEVAPDTIGRLGLAFLEFAPGIGEALSAAEAAKLKTEIDSARADGDFERAESLEYDYALAAFGAIPVLGKSVKLVKVMDRLIDTMPVVKRQIYRQKLLKAHNRYGDTVEGFSIKGALGEERWAALSPKTRKSMHNIVNYRMGEAGEKLVKQWLEHADIGSVGSNVTARRRYEIKIEGGETVTRHFDEATARHFQSTFGGLWMKRVEGGKGWEVKTGNAGPSANQREFANLAGKDDTLIASKPSRKKPINLPEIDKQAENLRVPLADVDESALRFEIRKSLHKNGHGRELVGEVDKVIEQFFETSRAANRSGSFELAQNFTVGSVLFAVSASLTEGVDRPD